MYLLQNQSHPSTVHDFIGRPTSEANLNTQDAEVPTEEDKNDATEKWWRRWGETQQGRTSVYLHERGSVCVFPWVDLRFQCGYYAFML